MFCCNPRDIDKEMPNMKGRAAEVKHLIPAFAEVWKIFMNRGDDGHKAVLQGLQASHKMDTILDSYPPKLWTKLPADEQQTFEKAGWIYLQAQNYLALTYNAPPFSLQLFNVTPKTHYLAHILLLSREYNPRLGWCYSGEHLMSKFKFLESSCVKGFSPESGGELFIMKYIFSGHGRWT